MDRELHDVALGICRRADELTAEYVEAMPYVPLHSAQMQALIAALLEFMADVKDDDLQRRGKLAALTRLTEEAGGYGEPSGGDK